MAHQVKTAWEKIFTTKNLNHYDQNNNVFFTKKFNQRREKIKNKDQIILNNKY